MSKRALGAAGADGEREVLDIPRGYIDNRWPTFAAFLHTRAGCRELDAHQIE
jgi:hypothetical protein